MSSANSLILLYLTLSTMSFMYIKNSVGPSTVPYGTPDVTTLRSDEMLPITALW